MIGKDDKVEQRVVEVGDWLGNDWFINQGLQPGERVVVDGAIRLSAGAAVNVVAAHVPAATPSPADGPAPAAPPIPGTERLRSAPAAGSGATAPEGGTPGGPPAGPLPAYFFFDPDSATLTAEARAAVASLAAHLKQNADARVHVTGYADKTGTRARNLELAKARAKAIHLALSGRRRGRAPAEPQGAGRLHRRSGQPAGTARRRASGAARHGPERLAAGEIAPLRVDEHLAFLHRPADLRVGHLHHHHAGGRGGDGQPAGRAVPRHHAAQITVSATYPGATAEVVANNVAAPIEQQVNGADNMIYMSSTTSSTGSMTLTIFFEIGTDPSLAQVDVQNRVNLALPQLPQSVQAQGVSVQKRSSAFMMIIAVYSPDDRFSETYVANYANLYVLDAIKRVPGANQATIFGTPDYAMRIWLKPDRMASLGITADRRAAGGHQPEPAVRRRPHRPAADRPAGRAVVHASRPAAGSPSRAQFDNIILRAASGGAAHRAAEGRGPRRARPQGLFDLRAPSTARRRRSWPSTSSRAPTRSTCRRRCARRWRS